jgi:hypothetical protein
MNFETLFQCSNKVDEKIYYASAGGNSYSQQDPLTDFFELFYKFAQFPQMQESIYEMYPFFWLSLQTYSSFSNSNHPGLSATFNVIYNLTNKASDLFIASAKDAKNFISYFEIEAKYSSAFISCFLRYIPPTYYSILYSSQLLLSFVRIGHKILEVGTILKNFFKKTLNEQLATAFAPMVLQLSIFVNHYSANLKFITWLYWTLIKTAPKTAVDKFNKEDHIEQLVYKVNTPFVFQTSY